MANQVLRNKQQKVLLRVVLLHFESQALVQRQELDLCKESNQYQMQTQEMVQKTNPLRIFQVGLKLR